MGKLNSTCTAPGLVSLHTAPQRFSRLRVFLEPPRLEIAGASFRGGERGGPLLVAVQVAFESQLKNQEITSWGRGVNCMQLVQPHLLSGALRRRVFQPRPRPGYTRRKLADEARGGRVHAQRLGNLVREVLGVAVQAGFVKANFGNQKITL
jgi:hypothetical protein